MPKINLLPWREEKRRETKQKFLLSGALCAAVTAAACFIGISQVYALRDGQITRNTRLENEISSLQQQLAEIETLDQTRFMLESRMTLIRNLQTERNKPTNVLSEIANRVPEGIFLDSISHKDNRLSLLGTATSLALVSSYIKELESSSWLSAPKLEIASSDDPDPRYIDAINKPSRFVLHFRTQNAQEIRLEPAPNPAQPKL